ncbi:MAG: ribosome biogenesis GTPase Der [Chromatiales bacterium]|nr:ribosome biogenesis GTPase Der [Chromatiales bacterium]
MQKLALIGRPNVGKSSLFNALLHKREAIVSAQRGLTRDRRYGVLKSEDQCCIIIDTGGLGDDNDIKQWIAKQTQLAIDESDTIALIVNAAEGLTPIDQSLAADIHKSGKNLWLIINKIDRQSTAYYQSEFLSLGIQPCFYTAATKGRGTRTLLTAIAAELGEPLPKRQDPKRIHLAVIGRPNVGKSTLVNTLINEPRMLTSATPGTTRDAISVPFDFDNRNFSLVDTAGIRRRSKLDSDTERFSVAQSLEHIVMGDVALLICDASEGITEQDARLAMHAIEQGCALVIALNKYDLLDSDAKTSLNRSVDVRFRFLDYVELYRISALKNRGLTMMMKAVSRAYDNACIKIPTAQCNRILKDAINRHPPPLVKNHRIKPRYICQSGELPPQFVISGGRVDCLPQHYKRYLASYIRRCFKLKGTPISLEFRKTKNPYAPN